MLKELENDYLEVVKPSVESSEILDRLDDAYKQINEMSQQEREFLNHLILIKKPKKLLEVGVSRGGSSIVILNAIQEIKGAHLHSIELSENYYKDSSLKSGYFVDNYPSLKENWTLYTGNPAYAFMDKIGSDIDFCLIDTVHLLPGEILDYLMVLPYLKNDAIVVFHDTNLHTYSVMKEIFTPWQFVNCILMSAICGIKLINGGFKCDYGKNVARFPNMAAIQLCKESKERIWEVFNLLTISWHYIPSNKQWGEIKAHFSRFYPKYYIDYLENVLQYQNVVANIKKQGRKGFKLKTKQKTRSLIDKTRLFLLCR